MQLPHLNPYGRAIKKYLFEMVGAGAYTTDLDEIADRIAHSLVTETDAKNVINLLGKVYGAGYQKAIDGVNEVMHNRGMNVKISPPSLN